MFFASSLFLIHYRLSIVVSTSCVVNSRSTLRRLAKSGTSLLIYGSYVENVAQVRTNIVNGDSERCASWIFRLRADDAERYSILNDQVQ